MISIVFNKKFYKKEKLLFATKSDLGNKRFSTDIINLFYTDISVDNICKLENKLYSATNQLDINADDIKAGFTKTVRYEISRAEKENIDIYYYKKDELLNPSIIDSINCAYMKFCDKKNNQSLKKYFDVNELEKLSKTDNVTVSYAKYAGGITYHVYYHDEHTCMLMFSFSNTHIENDIDKNIVGRANKLLHWRDMIYFKDIGLSVYDWGGLFNLDGKNGIDKFKLSFGAQPREAYNTIYGQTIWGKILVALYKLKNRGQQHG